MTRCALTAAALLAVVLGAGEARAAGGSTIYPVVISSQPGMEKSMAILHGAARSAIESSVEYGLGGGDAVTYGIPANASDFEAQARALFDEAKTDYENLELDSAIEKLDLAMKKLEGGAAFLTDLSLATDLLYYLGVCHSFNGDEDSSRKAFLRAYVLAPGKKPDPDVFPPDVITLFDDAVSNVGGIGVGSLAVTSEPAASQVYLDGQYMGLTPVTIDNVIAGKHFVRIVHAGQQLYGTVATVQSGKAAQVGTKMFPAYSASKVATLADGLPALLGKGVEIAAPSLASICQILGVQQLLIVWVTSGDSTSLSASFIVYDSGRSAVIAQRQGDSISIQEGVLSMKADELARNALAAALQSSAAGPGEVIVIGSPVKGGGEGGGPAGGEKESVVKKWWFWVALVGGAAAIGGATTAGVCLGTDACKKGGPTGPGGSGDLIFEF